MTFDQLIEHYGSQAEAARALGLKQPSIAEWKQATIPFDRQCQIQVATGGRLLARRSDDARLAKSEAA
jgi:DNA-binding transcriptional regulator YdaS (Cro superfamily)